MVENKSIEDSLNKLVDGKESERPEMSKEEEIGFHKGSLNTLAAERNELVKMVMNVESIMQAHAQRLKELGVEFGKK